MYNKKDVHDFTLLIEKQIDISRQNAFVLSQWIISHYDINIKDNEKIPYQEIVDLYHKKLPSLSKVVKLTDKRKKQIKKIYKDKKTGLPTLFHWENYFSHVMSIDFLMGRIQQFNHRTFKADLEWLTNYSNFIKIQENKYE